jgi:hypothetical protein
VNSRRSLPVARLGLLRVRSTVYGLATLDCNGRLAETTVVRALGWVLGTRLDIHKSSGLVLVVADLRGVFRLTGQGYVRLPATVRHWCASAADAVGRPAALSPPYVAAGTGAPAAGGP